MILLKLERFHEIQQGVWVTRDFSTLAVSWSMTSAASWGMEGEVASMRLLIVGLGRVRKSQGRQLISKMYTDNQNLQRCRGKRHNSKKKKKRVHEREQIDQVAGYTTPFPLLWSLIALN